MGEKTPEEILDPTGLEQYTYLQNSRDEIATALYLALADQVIITPEISEAIDSALGDAQLTGMKAAKVLIYGMLEAEDLLAPQE